MHKCGRRHKLCTCTQLRLSAYYACKQTMYDLWCAVKSSRSHSPHFVVNCRLTCLHAGFPQLKARAKHMPHLLRVGLNNNVAYDVTCHLYFSKGVAVQDTEERGGLMIKYHKVK